MRETAVAPKTNYTVAMTALNATTGKQNLGRVNVVRLVSSVDCFVQFKLNSAPTAATTTDMFLPAYSPEYFNVPHDVADDVYVSGIVASSTGTLYVGVMR